MNPRAGFEWGGGGKPDYGPTGCCQSTGLLAVLGALAGALLGLKVGGIVGRARPRN